VTVQRPVRKVRDTRITLAHGSGGKAMHDLIEDVFVATFDNAALDPLEDQARLPLAEFVAQGDRLAFTTDSYVVDPLFFSGGDIGRLAVTGTVNDLAVGGAKPLYLSCAIIAEEGLDIALLRRVAGSMQDTAVEAGIKLVTGDTKVVPRGAADKLFVTTAGIGIIPAGLSIAAGRAQRGDAILVNGTLGDHGIAIMQERADLGLAATIASDCQPLNGLVASLMEACPDVHCLRDATRGGVATVLNEFAAASRLCIRIRETALPIRDEVRGVCELLGLDPLYVANEGKLVAVVAGRDAERALAALRSHPAGRQAAIIGEVAETPEETVILITPFGGSRILDMLVGEQLPRIC
jgi:hydrogenase expression/formation protein HypE